MDAALVARLARAKVTASIFAVSALVFAAEVVAARALVVRDAVLLAFGAIYTPFIVGEGRVETLVTGCFLHVSLVHFAANAAILVWIGPRVEAAVGSARYASMYLASGVAASAVSTAWDLREAGAMLPGAGASGALCGVVASALVLAARTEGWRSPRAALMAAVLALTFAIGWMVHADNAAHAGGAVAGAAMAAAWRRGVVYSRARQRITLGACAALVALSGAAVAARDALDPWAALDVDDRVQLAAAAVQTGSCADAIGATERARRLAPRAATVRALERAILARCTAR